jgi:hypothetical protein
VALAGPWQRAQAELQPPLYVPASATSPPGPTASLVGPAPPILSCLQANASECGVLHRYILQNGPWITTSLLLRLHSCSWVPTVIVSDARSDGSIS